jgi:hypothetical protein
MGGISYTVKSNDLMELMTKFTAGTEYYKSPLGKGIKLKGHDLYLDGLTLMVKCNGKWITCGSRGIEEGVGKTHLKRIPKERFILFAHFHT